MKSNRNGLFTYVLSKLQLFALIDAKLFCFDVANIVTVLGWILLMLVASLKHLSVFVTSLPIYIIHTDFLVGLFVFTSIPLLIVFMVIHATALDV